MSIKWEKKGLFIVPQRHTEWQRSHAMIPTPQYKENGIFRIFYSGRNENNQSIISFADIDLTNEPKVINYSQKPVLGVGKLGCFDDNGVTPSCVISLSDKEMALYYIGWNPGSTVRMHLFGGLAISKDNGEVFKRWSEAPIIERSITDPYLNTAPWVVKNKNQFQMFYVSGCGWIHKDLPRYNIKTAFSKDGKKWDRQGHVCIDFKNEGENALARPYVIFHENIWKMWFAYKGENYRLGYAESLDGIDWRRLDHKVGISTSSDGFDSEMIEYAAVIPYKNKFFMLYNGNNYGYDGILLAVSK